MKKTFNFEYIGTIAVEANNEKEAQKKFDSLPNELLGKYVHSAEILSDEYNE